MTEASRTGPGAGLLAQAERRMAWLERRHEVLARNVANADTPGFRAMDLTPATSGAAQLARTHRDHLAARGTDPLVRPSPSDASPDGNSVALDRELARLAETEIQHGFATGAHRRFSAMLRTALGRAG
jgi:flagellar basal-body rod protein FlgB